MIPTMPAWTRASARRRGFAGARGRRRFRWFLGVVAAVGLVVRVLYTYAVARDLQPGLDSVWYLLVGGGLYEGAGYVDPEARFLGDQSVPTANFPPLYPGVVALVRAVAGTSATAVQLAGAVLGTVTVVLTGLIGRRVAGPVVGLVAAGLVAVNPSLLAADGSAMSENVFVPLVTGAVLCLLRARASDTHRWWLAAGLLLGLATLARPDGLILGAVLVVGAAIADRRDASAERVGRGPAGPALAVLVLAVVVMPWSVYASARMDAVVVTSTATDKTLAGANCDLTWSRDGLGSWDAGCLRAEVPGDDDEIARAEAWRSDTVDYVARHPERLLVSAVARVARTFGLWAPAPLLDAEVVETRSRPWQTLAWVVWLPLLAAAVWGFGLLRRRGAETWPILSLVVGVTLSAVLAWGNQRFRLAAEPVILVASATAVVQLLRRVVSPSRVDRR